MHTCSHEQISYFVACSIAIRFLTPDLFVFLAALFQDHLVSLGCVVVVVVSLVVGQLVFLVVLFSNVTEC